MFRDLISSCYAQIDSTFTNECRDVCCWQEDKCEWKVFYKRNVKTIVAVKLYIRTLEEIKAWLVESALCMPKESAR